MKQKHPHSKVADLDVLLPGIPEKIHPIKTHSIDAGSVKKAILKTKGVTRPSALDAAGWKRILTSRSGVIKKKLSQWRGQHRVILQQLQYTQSPLYHSYSCY